MPRGLCMEGIGRRRHRFLRRTVIPVKNVNRFHPHETRELICSSTEALLNNGRNCVLSRTLPNDRIEHVDEFCSCKNCSVVSKIPARYAYCCREANDSNENADMANHLSCKLGTLSCITEHPAFSALCLNKEILNVLATHEKVCHVWLGPIPTFDNQCYRYLAYRSFSYWVYGDEAKGNRLEPPLCVLSAIVKRFPVEELVTARETSRGLDVLFGYTFFYEYKEDGYWYSDDDGECEYI
ncbi:hypothetical protein AB6A40_006661 [Gnathostoma spinigerum]|uniref:P2X purinoreceptor 7 intracellular domain-containing protein n=1 Tax=Gnathostoma spinigerum TaxID=75299 RepID=A0ABD6ETE5_9BILA